MKWIGKFNTCNIQSKNDDTIKRNGIVVNKNFSRKKSFKIKLYIDD